jgi:hypothetical protein
VYFLKRLMPFKFNSLCVIHPASDDGATRTARTPKDRSSSDYNASDGRRTDPTGMQLHSHSVRPRFIEFAGKFVMSRISQFLLYHRTILGNYAGPLKSYDAYYSPCQVQSCGQWVICILSGPADLSVG